MAWKSKNTITVSFGHRVQRRDMGEGMSAEVTEIKPVKHRRPAVWDAVRAIAQMWSGVVTLGDIEEIINNLIDAIVEEVKNKQTCKNCGGSINTISGYRICERGCGGPV